MRYIILYATVSEEMKGQIDAVVDRATEQLLVGKFSWDFHPQSVASQVESAQGIQRVIFDVAIRPKFPTQCVYVVKSELVQCLEEIFGFGQVRARQASSTPEFGFELITEVIH